MADSDEREFEGITVSFNKTDDERSGYVYLSIRLNNGHEANIWMDIKGRIGYAYLDIQPELCGEDLTVPDLHEALQVRDMKAA